ncbi:MAG: RIP metalloprotease RseP [Thermodesulfobacteriota bacterium]
MNYLISIIIVLGPVIFIHELGHFIWAKFFNVKVLKFSLGFGPKLISRTYGETEYLLSALPIGGYVKMLGEQQEEEITPEEKDRSFAEKPVWQRFIIVAFGPIFNLLFAIFIFFMIFAVAGVPSPVDNTVISGVAKDSPAQRAGLQADDVIKSINGTETVKWMDVAKLISASEGGEVHLVIDRNGERLEITGKPELRPDFDPIFGTEKSKRYMLGISRSDEVIYKEVSLPQALAAGCYETWAVIYLTGKAVQMAINKVLPAKDLLGGPILIAQQAGKQMDAGWMALIRFMGLISVSLGMINLLPIPILDGGHLMFFTYEAIFRKPMPQKIMEMALQAGLVVLVTLMVFVIYNDIVKLFTQG